MWEAALWTVPMHKLVVYITKQEGMDHEDYLQYWDEEHVPLVKTLPNLVKYTTSLPANPDSVDHDGIAELYFETREELDEAVNSDTGHAALADLVNFTEADPDQVIVEETVRLDET